MDNNVRAHIQEMLDIGAIHKSHSPWASTVVLLPPWEAQGCFAEIGEGRT